MIHECILDIIVRFVYGVILLRVSKGELACSYCVMVMRSVSPILGLTVFT